MSKTKIASLCVVYKRFALIGLALVLLFLIMSDVPTGDLFNYEAKAESNQISSKVDVHYFYFNPCPSCDVEKEFLIRLDTILGNNKENINLRMFNAFYGSVAEKLLQFYDKYDVAQEHRTPPILFIGNAYIQGSANIDNRLKEEFDKAKQQVERIQVSTVESQIAVSPDAERRILVNSTGTDTRIMYFYVQLCAECEDVESFFNELETNYNIMFEEEAINSKVEIYKFDISKLENLNLLRAYFYRFGIPEDRQLVPVLFIGEHYLVGAEDIKSKLHDLILSGEGLLTPILHDTAKYSVETTTGLTKFDFAGIITAGLVDGVSPCSISMLLFFLSIVASKGLTTIKIGLSFIFGRFVAYFLLGTLFFNILLAIDAEIMQSIEWIMKGFMLLAILFLVVFNIRDYFAAKTEKYDRIKMQLPVVLRRINHNWIKSFMSVKNPRLLIAVSFILGILISIGEFLCTGQIFLLTIVYIMRVSPQLDAMAVFSFLIYGLALIIPMILLLYAIHIGKEVFVVSELVRKNFQYIKLLNAFVFLVFGLIILFVL